MSQAGLRPSVEELFDAGLEDALHGRWKQALSSWEAALVLDPHNAPLLCNVGVARRKLGA